MGVSTHSTALAVLLLSVSSGAFAQSGRLSRPAVFFEAGLAAPATVVRDANGAKLQTGIAPVLGAGGSWLLGPRLRSVVGARASTAGLNGSEDGSTWEAGRTTQLGLHVGLEQSVTRRFSVSLVAGPTWLMGPDDVTPFRDSPSPLHWGGSVGAGWRLMQSRPVSVVMLLEGFMVGGSSAADPVAEPAWLRRIVLGARYGP